MAILRKELQGKAAVTCRRNEHGQMETINTGVFDAIAETEADLTAEETAVYAPGSMVYCLQEDSLRIKTTAGVWEELCL